MTEAPQAKRYASTRWMACAAVSSLLQLFDDGLYAPLGRLARVDSSVPQAQSYASPGWSDASASRIVRPLGRRARVDSSVPQARSYVSLGWSDASASRNPGTRAPPNQTAPRGRS